MYFPTAVNLILFSAITYAGLGLSGSNRAKKLLAQGSAGVEQAAATVSAEETMAAAPTGSPVKQSIIWFNSFDVSVPVDSRPHCLSIPRIAADRP